MQRLVVVKPGLYAIYDHPHRFSLSPEEVVSAIVAGGVGCLQLRAKLATTEERVALLDRMGPLCLEAGCQLWVNDDLEAACSGVAGISGLHVGQEDIGALVPRWRAKCRAAAAGAGDLHDLRQLRDAEAHDPDYIAFGPVFVTTGKDDPDPVVGLAGLEAAAVETERPIVAIGGIDEVSASVCLDRGATAVAVIGALVASTVSETERRAANLVAVCDAALAPPGAGASPRSG